MPPAVIVFRAEVEMTTRTELAVGPFIVATSTTSRFAAEVAIYPYPQDPPPTLWIGIDVVGPDTGAPGEQHDFTGVTSLCLSTGGLYDPATGTLEISAGATGDQLDNLPGEEDPFDEVAENPTEADFERWGRAQTPESCRTKPELMRRRHFAPQSDRALAELLGARLAAADQVEAAAAVAMDVDRGAPQKRGVFGPRFDLLGSPSSEAPAIIMRGGRSA